MAHLGKFGSSFRYFVVISALLVSLLVLLGWKQHPQWPHRIAQFKTQLRQPFKAQRVVKGDQYLIGVGKADITG
jgi:hypothetical protein